MAVSPTLLRAMEVMPRDVMSEAEMNIRVRARVRTMRTAMEARTSMRVNARRFMESAPFVTGWGTGGFPGRRRRA